jgi:hypothetical protein
VRACGTGAYRDVPQPGGHELTWRPTTNNHVNGFYSHEYAGQPLHMTRLVPVVRNPQTQKEDQEARARRMAAVCATAAGYGADEPPPSAGGAPRVSPARKSKAMAAEHMEQSDDEEAAASAAAGRSSRRRNASATSMKRSSCSPPAVPLKLDDGSAKRPRRSLSMEAA